MGQNNISKRGFTSINFIKSWEFILIVLLFIVFVIDANLSPNFLKISNLLDTTQNFMEVSIMTLPMTLIIMTGFIDISIASIIAMGAAVMSVCFKAGINFGLSIFISLVVGILAGYLNGIIITKIKIPSIVVTLATMLFYRGIAYILLKDTVITGFPEKFGFLGGIYKPLFVPIQLIIFIVLAVVFGIVLHFTSFGRKLYAIGNNEMTCRYSGIMVDKIRIILYVISGLLAAFIGIMLASRLGSVRPDFANTYELKVITIVVLGGVAIFGGRGSMIGVILSTFIIGYINYGLKLINIQDQIITIITGSILIITLIVPRIISAVGERRIRSKKSF